MKRINAKNERGVTAIELMVAVAILGILGTMSVMGSRTFLDSFGLRAATRQIFTDFQQARLSAIKDGRAWAVCFAPGNTAVTAYTVRNTPGADNVLCTPDDLLAGPVRKTVTLGAGEYSTLAFAEGFAGTSLVFNPNGTASAGNLTITKSDGGALQVTVNANTGNLRIQ